MIAGSFKNNGIYEQFVYKWHIFKIHMYKQDLALDNLKAINNINET